MLRQVPSGFSVALYGQRRPGNAVCTLGHPTPSRKLVGSAQCENRGDSDVRGNTASPSMAGSPQEDG